MVSPDFVAHDRVLTRVERCERHGISPATDDRQARAGIGPRRIRLSAGRVGYRLSDLLAWEEERAEERPAAA